MPTFETMIVEDENGKPIMRTIARISKAELDKLGIKTAEDLANFDQEKFWQEHCTVENAFEQLWNRSFN
jgi:hypothetical protein